MICVPRWVAIVIGVVGGWLVLARLAPALMAGLDASPGGPLMWWDPVPDRAWPLAGPGGWLDRMIGPDRGGPGDAVSAWFVVLLLGGLLVLLVRGAVGLWLGLGLLVAILLGWPVLHEIGLAMLGIAIDVAHRFGVPIEWWLPPVIGPQVMIDGMEVLALGAIVALVFVASVRARERESPRR